jgi:predicted nucleic acid-binding protein
MRVVLDTNILISALLIQVGHPAVIYRAWQEGAFTLVVCAEQLDELRATLRKSLRESNPTMPVAWLTS